MYHWGNELYGRSECCYSEWHLLPPGEEATSFPRYCMGQKHCNYRSTFTFMFSSCWGLKSVIKQANIVQHLLHFCIPLAQIQLAAWTARVKVMKCAYWQKFWMKSRGSQWTTLSSTFSNHDWCAFKQRTITLFVPWAPQACIHCTLHPLGGVKRRPQIQGMGY